MEKLTDGINGIISSPSGVFSLLILSIIVYLTVKCNMGSGPIITYVGVIIPTLHLIEHLEFRILDNKEK